MIDIYIVAVPGPLGIHKEALGADLNGQGYSPLSVRNLLRLTAHLSRWIVARGIDLQRLMPEDVDEFVASRRRASSKKSMTRAALAPILGFLQRCNAIPALDFAPAQEPLTPLLQDYEDYLLRERSLNDSTVQNYLSVARRFLADGSTQESRDIASLGPRDMIKFIHADVQRYSTGTAKLHVTALRAFLRYLHVTGQTVSDLSTLVPSVAHWRLGGLPRGLEPQEIRRLLATCDRRTQSGRTDFAMLFLLVRLGLRCCEVAALELEDIDWRQRWITLRGKGREERLPLPEDVVQALIRHLKAPRPDINDRHVFLRRRAPMGPMSAGAIRARVQQHLRQAGISPPLPHRLRHTAATRMLHQGASLDQIAQVLRHHSVDTTAIYAKVDRNQLRDLSQPWPEVNHD